MAANPGSWLFRKRTWIGALLVAGAVVGVYLSDFFKGWGGGPGLVPGPNAPSGNTSDTTPEKTPESPAKPTPDPATPTQPLPQNVPDVVKVVIDERSYALRTDEGDKPTDATEIVKLVKAAKGDVDGIRLRVYRKGSSRPSAETSLQEALAAAGISEDAILWVPTPVE